MIRTFPQNVIVSQNNDYLKMRSVLKLLNNDVDLSTYLYTIVMRSLPK